MSSQPFFTRLMLVVCTVCSNGELLQLLHCGPLRGVHGALGLLLRNRAGQEPKHDPEQPHCEPPPRAHSGNDTDRMIPIEDMRACACSACLPSLSPPSSSLSLPLLASVRSPPPPPTSPGESKTIESYYRKGVRRPQRTRERARARARRQRGFHVRQDGGETKLSESLYKFPGF